MELLNLAEDGNPDAMKALSRQAVYLGKGLLNITAALSPELILLTGGLTSSWARFGHLVEAELAANMLAGTPPRIAVTNDAELARLRGAAALVLQRHSGYNRSQSGTRSRASNPNGKPTRNYKERSSRSVAAHV